MTVRRFIRAKVVALLVVLSLAGLATSFAGGFTSASSAQTPVQQAVSQNWAGYVAGGNTFSRVSGTWTQPSASSATQGYSAVWVGLGGTSGGSQSLEQIGTSADYVNGTAEYYAWYELLPSAQVRLGLSVHPGDRISASVSVSGRAVTVSLADKTTGGSVVKTLSMDSPDTSSAEWIVEAPAAEVSPGGYTILPLADFGTVTFSNASATAGGHTGAVSDSHWSATEVQLTASGGLGAARAASLGFLRSRRAEAQPLAGASTSALSGHGFYVSFRQVTSEAANASEPEFSRRPVPRGPFAAGGGGGYVPPYGAL